MVEVRPGQRFRKAAAALHTWEVGELVIDHEGIRHFRLRDVKDPSRSILVSEQALLNTRYFRAVDAQKIRRSLFSRLAAFRNRVD